MKQLASQLAPSKKIIVCGHDKYGIKFPTIKAVQSLLMEMERDSLIVSRFDTQN
jgi:hypothetical protein